MEPVKGQTEEQVSPVHKKEELVEALRNAVSAATAFCMQHSVNPAAIRDARGFNRVKLVEDAVAAFVVKR